MSSLAQLSEAAVNLTAEVNSTGAPPPAAAAANPLIELLLADIRRHLPEALQQKLAGAADPAAFLDWFGVAQLWRAMPRGVDRPRLLAEMASGAPARIALAWARTVAPYAPPAPPTSRQRAADFTGLALQFGLAALMLAMRCGAVCLLATAPSPASIGWWLGTLVYQPLLELPGRNWDLLLPFGLCVLELFAPPAMEWLRRAAFRAEDITPLVQQRVDGFFVAWRIQAVVMGGLCMWRFYN